MENDVKPLLIVSPIETQPKFIQLLEDACKFVKKIRQKDRDVVKSEVNLRGSKEDIKALQAGLMYLALTDPDPSRSLCTDIILTSRDNLTFVLTELAKLIAEYYPKFYSHNKINFIELLVELISNKGLSVEVLILHLMRRIYSGDVSYQNIWLAKRWISILENNRDWLDSNDRANFLYPLVVYTLLRIIPDHLGLNGKVINPPSDDPAFLKQGDIDTQALANQEINLAISLIKNKFEKCVEIGRDFMRLFYEVSKINSSFAAFWKELTTNCSSLMSKPIDFYEILYSPTPSLLIQTNICLELETWIKWMIRSVHCSPNSPIRRYQEFIRCRFFANPESETLKIGLIRYLVTSIYPDNTMLKSTLIPRWNLISGLLFNLPSGPAAKLALIYDWIFFKPSECIMNVEPAILAIMNNLNSRSVSITLALIDLLVTASNDYMPKIRTNIQQSIRLAVDEMIKLGVIKSINPLIEVLNRSAPDLAKKFIEILSSGKAPSPPTPMVQTNADKAFISDLNSSGQSTCMTTPETGTPPTDYSDEESMPVKAPINQSLTSPNNFSRQSNGSSKSTNNTKAPFNVIQEDSKASLSSDEIHTILNNKSQDGHSHEAKSFSHLSIDELRCAFREFEYQYSTFNKNFSDTFDLDTEISLLDDPLKMSMIKMKEVSKKIGMFKELDAEPLESSAEKNNSSPVSIKSPSHEEKTSLEILTETIEEVIQVILSDDCFDDLELAGRTASIICHLTRKMFEPVPIKENVHLTIVSLSSPTSTKLNNDYEGSWRVPLPAVSPLKEEEIDLALSCPIFLLFKHFCHMTSNDSKRELLLILLTEIHRRQPRIGYYLLYYLKLTKHNDEKMEVYRNFCASKVDPELKSSLYEDLKLLGQDNRKMFTFLLPDIYRIFKDLIAPDENFLKMVISNLDPEQMMVVLSEVIRGQLEVIPENQEDFNKILLSSLNWDYSAQTFFWQIINAHELPTKKFLNIISNVDSRKYPICVTNLLLILQLEKPTMEFVKTLMLRDDSGNTSGSSIRLDYLTTSVINYWSCPDHQNSHQFTKIFVNLINNVIKEFSNKQKSSTDTMDSRDHQKQLMKILLQLDYIRKSCRNITFIEQADVQNALQNIVQSKAVPAKIKHQFSDLFALVEESDVAFTPGSTFTAETKRISQSGNNSDNTTSSISAGSHSLRKLDSRRAAEAAKRGVNKRPITSLRPLNQMNNSDKPNQSDDDSEDDDGYVEDRELALTIDIDESGNRKKRTGLTSSDDSNDEEYNLKSSKDFNAKKQTKGTIKGSKEQKKSLKRSKMVSSSDKSQSDEDQEKKTGKRAKKTHEAMKKRSRNVKQDSNSSIVDIDSISSLSSDEEKQPIKKRKSLLGGEKKFL